MEELVPFVFVIQLEKGKVAAPGCGKREYHLARGDILAKLKCIPTVVGVRGLTAAVSEGPACW
jgi:hypothetical protein